MASTLNALHAVYVGSFDPMSLGHEDIVRRGAGMFERVTVGIGTNPEKRPLFSVDERLELVGKVLKPFPNVVVDRFDGLAVDFIHRCQASIMLRGLRTLSDIEAEFTQCLANRVLAPDIETVFLMAGEKYAHISSTLVKQIAQMGHQDIGDKLRAFVPELFIHPLINKFAARKK